MFHFSDTWQLVINTGTTIVTFLMIFLLQNAQNRDSSAIQLKLDELVRVNQDARNKLLTLEDLTEAEVEKIKATFAKLAENTDAKAGLAEAVEDLEGARRELEEAQKHIAGAKASKSGIIRFLADHETE